MTIVLPEVYKPQLHDRMIRSKRTLAFSGCFKVLLPSPSYSRNASLMENRLHFLILYMDFCSLESPLVPGYHYCKSSVELTSL